MAETFTFTIKPQADLSDILSHIKSLENAFSNLKLPKNLGGELKNQADNLRKILGEYDKLSKNVKTPGDLNKLDKTGAQALDVYHSLLNTIKEIGDVKLDTVVDSEAIREAKKAVDEAYKAFNQLDEVKFKGIDEAKKQFDAFAQSTSSKKIKTIKSSIDEAFNAKQFGTAYKELKNLYDYLGGKEENVAFKRFGDSAQKAATNFKQAFQGLANNADLQPLLNKLEQAEGDLTKLTGEEVLTLKSNLEQVLGAVGNNEQAFQKWNQTIHETGKASLQLSKSAQTLERQVEAYFGLNAIFRTVANMAREAMQTVKQLDAAMTETAVVTDFSVGDMWEKLPIYTAEANKLGSTIEDVYRATTLYYQQGLNTNQSMGLAVETLKMARIAGMDAKDATNAMTAALRGFNLELNELSARRINDVYSELAAITASDTQEISTAMEKVASLAHNAGMEVETTSAFLAQMIETTREAPENLGTALKTVIARFQEMKEDPTKLVDSEGVMLDANKIDKALKSIGVNLMDTNGEFRKLDDVFLEISAKWDSLSKGQQRYIATVAAGSRQQSRFIAMMSDYSRTMELVNAAYDAGGASQRQFEKTLESMDTKLKQLKNAWDQFTMGLMNSDILKVAVDFGREFLDTVNRIINAVSGGNGLIKSIITLGATFGGLTSARTFLSAGITNGFSWFKGETTTKDMFKNILFSGRNNISKQFSQAGIDSAINFQNAFNYNIRKFQPDFQYLLSGLGSNQTQLLLNNLIKVKPDIQFDDADVGRIQDSIKNNGFDATADELSKQFDIPVEKLIPKIEGADTAMGKFAVTGAKAGVVLQSFGTLLRGTPLAPFGMALQVAGGALTAFSGLLVGVDAQSKKTVVGLKALKTNLIGMAPAIGIFIALAAAITVVYMAVTENKRRLEALSKVAQDASNNLDTLKQNATEFKSSLEQIQANKDAFKDLVPGTLEFNEKLIESNQLILELINKYEELKDKLQVDEFGRYFIADNDLNEFYETLQHRQQIGQSLSLLTDFAVTEEKAKQEISKINDSYQKLLRPEYGNRLTDEGVAISTKESFENNDMHIAYNKASEDAAKEIAEKQRELEIQRQATYSSAIQGAIAGLDIDNSATANILAQQYERYLEGVGELTTEEAVELYARQNNMSTADVTADKELKNFAIKEAPTIKALQNIYDNAEKVDNVLESVDKDVYAIFEEDFGDNKTFFTDLFGRNKDTDTELVKQFNKNAHWVHEMVEALSDDMVLQFEPQFDNESIDKARTQLEEDLKQAGQDLIEIQKPIYEDLATIYMRSSAASKSNPEKFGKTTTVYEASAFRNSVKAELEQLSATQANFIGEIAKELESHVGNDATAEFMSNAVSIYSSGVSSRIQEMETILTDVDWTNAISRLEAYDAMIQSKDESIQKFGQSMMDAAEEANLLGEAVYQVASSEDFEKIYEKRDDYVNSFGKFDATGIKKMREESSLLDRLLATGTITANGFAQALNTLDDTGSLNGLTTAVLELISEFDSLGEVMSDAHDIVSNFNPGIDTGEGEDFVKKNYEEVKKYWDNYEVGNEQLINYLKLYAGEDRWNKLSQKYNGNLEKIERAIINGDKEHSAMSLFANGFEEAWIKGANQGYSKDGISLGWDKGFIDLDIGDKTTDEVVTWLQEVYGISEEYAKLMLTDFENYSADLKRDLARNDWNKALPDFIAKKTRDNGNTVLTQEEIDTIASARGVTAEQVLKEIRQQAPDVRVFDKNRYTDKEGNINYEKALQGWINKTVGTRNEEGKLEGDFSDYLKETGDKVNELAGAVTDMQSSGIPLSDTQEMLYSKIAGTDGEYTYKGVELTDKDTKTLDNFIAKMAEIDQMDQWKNIGHYIAEGMFEYQHQHEKPETTSPQTVTATTDTGTSGGSQTKEVDVTIDKTVNEEVNTTENYDENGSNSLREKAIQREEELKKITELPKKEAIDTIEAEKQLLDLERQQALLKREIAQKEAVGLDTSDARSQLDTVHSKLQAVKNKIDEIREKRKITLEITTEGSIPKGAVQYGHDNYISSTGFYAGSAAYGHHGTVGPKNRGGLTLTGEKGFEIAWIPSENRSMILGAQGPQLADLPADTVVYTHEQSKKIVKQKGIPAGSHSTRGVHNKGSNTGTNHNSDHDSGSDDKDSNKKSSHTNWLKIEVERFNLNQKINQNTIKIEKATQTIDKTLAKIGTKYSDISATVVEEIKLLKQSNKWQENLAKGYKKQLENLNAGSYKKGKDTNKRHLYMNLTNSKGESKEKRIGTGQFVEGDIETGYQINRKEIEKYLISLGNYGKKGSNLLRQNVETMFNALQSELSSAQSGFDNATKSIEDNKNKIKELRQTLVDTFYGWENELTKTYNLSQKLNTTNTRRDTNESQTDLILARVSAGLLDINQAASLLTATQAKDIKLLKDKISLQQRSIEATKIELKDAVSDSDEKKAKKQAEEEYKDIQAKVKKGEATKEDEENARAKYTAAKENAKIATLVDKYMGTTLQADGTQKINVDYKQLEKDRQAGKITEETYNKIKEGIENAISKNDELIQMQGELNQSFAEFPQMMREDFETLASLEKDLLTALETRAQEEINSMKSVNESLTKGFKNVYDQVKRSIDARRQNEQNAKTESDINQKQQRLATLQANTSGGNQAEIAQLRKEITDAQASYKNTLEDQLLNRLSTQNDEAKMQRDLQIAIAQERLNWAKESGVHAEQVNMLIQNMSTAEGQAAIRGLLSTDNTPSAPFFTSLVEAADINNTITGAAAAITELDLLDTAGFTTETGNIVSGITTAMANLSTDSKMNELFGDGSNLSNIIKSVATGEQLSTVIGGLPHSEQLMEAVGAIDISPQLSAAVTDMVTKINLADTISDLATGEDLNTICQEGGSFYNLIKSLPQNTDFAQLIGPDSELYQLLSLFPQGQALLKELGKEGELYKSLSALPSGSNMTGLLGQGSVLNDSISGLLTNGQLSSSITNLATGGDLAENADNVIGGMLTVDDIKTSISELVTQAKLASEVDRIVQKLNGGEESKNNSSNSTNNNSSSSNSNKSDKGKKEDTKKDDKKKEEKKNITNAQIKGIASAIWLHGSSTSGWGTGETRLNRIDNAFTKGAGKKVQKYINDNQNNSKAWTSKAEAKKYFKSKFKKGGLAKFTGPAWLDGTKSKPELVLNTQDTKNFIVLKDVLSEVMRNVSHINQTSDVYNAPTEFNININVDKIANDYDVDKLAARIKKDIVKDASYRNVTRVRNFR